MKKFLLFAFLAIIFAIGITIYQKSSAPLFLPKINNNPQTTIDSKTTEIIVENLDIPWSMAFLPDGNFLFTERSGNLNLFNSETKEKNLISEIEVALPGEGGLHGVEIDPNFSSNNFIYLYYTYSGSGDNSLNRVVRYKFINNALEEEKIIVDVIPGASNHDGGRIKFGPDNYLYITTGDAQEPTRAQDKNSLAGKILRVNRDGSPAPGNPFNTRVYSYGHRNPQGITWDDNNNLYSTEHGRSGVLSGLDELNLIESGKNYGWPDIEGAKEKSGMETPLLNSGENDTWAPGGMTYFKNKIYFTGLRGSALYIYDIETKQLSSNFKDEFGRIRDVVLGPDNMLYIATSNKDGRGTVRENDDKIIRINPNKL